MGEDGLKRTNSKDAKDIKSAFVRGGPWLCVAVSVLRVRPLFQGNLPA